jgi:hypothetical protein
MLRWRNLVILFIVDDVLYVLSAVTIDNKHHAGTASVLLLVLFLIGVVALIAGVIVLARRGSRSSSRQPD